MIHIPDQTDRSKITIVYKATHGDVAIPKHYLQKADARTR